uniref:Ig-like domain-containing protein n=1 Tax=Anser cygnoides TaxID=8845 RepID=A0A8B9DMZ4_ANSCY
MTSFPGILGVFRSHRRTALTLLRSVVAWVWTLLHCGDAQAVPVQHPAMRTSAEGGSASMACRLTKEDTVHWYKQLPGEPPKRILYVSGKKPTFDDGTDEKKYQVRKHASEPHYSLTIDYVTQRDAGTYYCTLSTVSGYYYEVFGSGTKLIVSGNSKPENSEILQTKHKDQLLYVCLIENFYPEVIRVQWVDGADKEVTKNVVKGDVWKSTNDKYSVSTWLTLPVNMTNKNYFCKYDHESQENFKLPIQGIYCFFIIYLFSFYILLCLFLSFFFFLLFEYN